MPARPRPRALIPVSEAARMLGCSPATVRNRIAAGQLRSWSLGPRMTRVDRWEVAALAQDVTPA